jgi:hypothetical protein
MSSRLYFDRIRVSDANMTALSSGTTKISSLVFAAGTQPDFQVDQTTPADGWADITCDINVKGSGVNNPAWSLFRDNIYAFEFPGTGMKEVWANVHIPHNYSPGTGLYFHVHWAPNVAGGTGNIKWQFEYTYASRDGTYGATTTTSVVQAMPAQYTHTITEIASPVLTGQLEVDGLLLIRCFRDAGDAQDTSTQSAFLFFIDCHINTSKFSTKYRNKATGSFYA